MSDTTTPTAEPATETATATPSVLRLDDDRATDVSTTGGKAAALATAATHDMPILPGVVLTTSFCEDIDGGDELDGHPAVRQAFDEASGAGQRLVARSSSTVEDAAESSQAGQFESVIGIDGLDELTAAVGTVLQSREQAGAIDRPIAVLVQPFVAPRYGGVLFGVDPVTGRSDHRVITAVEGQPDPLVSGEVEGSRYVIDAEGAVAHVDQRDGALLPDDLIHELVRLSDRATEVFDGAQDVEWAVVDDQLLLLQSRPVTTEIRGVPHGPVYGPGPVAETFPEPLATLEADLWIPPLRDAVAEALQLAGAATADDVAGPDLVVVVDGYAAIDLERTGEIETERSNSGGLGVVRRIRRLRSAWRVGRLRTALPSLADRVLQQVDEDLSSLPRLNSTSDRQLVALLGRSREALRSLHAYEMLMGLLTDAPRGQLTGASVAMRVLTEARSDGRPDAEIVARSPVVLALSGPRIDAEPRLPAPSSTPSMAPPPESGDGDGAGTTPAVIREALRLRVRWIQELSARAAWELGTRLHRAERLVDPRHVRLLALDDLIALATQRAEAVFDVLEDRTEHPLETSPLPARFQISDRGRPVAYRSHDGAGGGGGTGAGGGRETGAVTHDADDPPAGSVLVVTALSPDLGPKLSRLSGLVAETGSVLAHLAILAREAGLPTVVGYEGATTEFDDGEIVAVDGDSGHVSVEEDSES